ncbi:hypothetical protein MKJ04_15165 [Pontibacter sp. E15-1]|uniref:hypothetical protein n=1 Tax=Pontibacter sp. E15-1 TaxID=2919918 RepID=UPI001F4F6139|nr:hypothetical protein [Pontibacter sp. E15-1]MCJ8166186.1 hypothetical protein [Pontibacter sp. E15-1]
MHDIDRTLREQEYADEMEFDQELNDEANQGYGYEMDELGGDGFGNETDQSFSQEFDLEFLYQNEDELPDSLEMELAYELLSVSNEQELDQFLGKLVRRAGRAVGKFARSSAGRAIGGILKKVAKGALPIAGKALGTFVGGPLGGALGGKLGSMASNLFELELEGMSPEDQELEVSKAYVRFANNALRQGAAVARKNPGAAASQIARAAIRKSASRYAPGLISRGGASGQSVSLARKGTWMRRGKTIVLYGF